MWQRYKKYRLPHSSSGNPVTGWISMWCHSISSAFKLDFLVHISSFSSIAIVGLKHDDFLSCYVTGAMNCRGPLSQKVFNSSQTWTVNMPDEQKGPKSCVFDVEVNSPSAQGQWSDPWLTASTWRLYTVVSEAEGWVDRRPSIPMETLSLLTLLQRRLAALSHSSSRTEGVNAKQRSWETHLIFQHFSAQARVT